MLCLSGTAAAQITRYPVEAPSPVPQEGLSVLERSHPGYEPFGLPLSSFYVFPSVDLSATYDSNIFATANHDKDDVFFTIAPEVGVVSNWARHALAFDAAAQEKVYALHSSEDVTNFRTGLTGRLDITEDYVTGGAGYVLDHEDRSAPDNIANVKNPIQVQTGSAWLRYVHELGIIGVRGEGRITAYGYDNGVTTSGVTVPLTYRDRIEYAFTPRASYEFYPGYFAFLETPVNWRVYNAKFDIAGFQRSSHGYRVNAGLSVALTGISFGRAFIGYLDQEYDDPRLKPSAGLGFGGDVLWNATPITSVRFYVARTVEEAVPTETPGLVIPASSILQTEANIGVEHALFGNVVLWGRVGYIDQAFEGTTRADTIVWGQTGVRYLINPWVNVGFDIDYHNRSSTQSGNDYSREQISARVRIQD